MAKQKQVKTKKTKKAGESKTAVQTNMNQTQQGQQPSLDQQVRINAQYIKDFSFENPKSPKSLMNKEQPSVQVDLNIKAQRFGDGGMFEVILDINANTSVKGDPLFMVELKYAGLFTLRNIPENEVEPALLVYCPNLIFPFARRIIADATRDGGFQPLLLDPVDFARLYLQRKQGQAKLAVG